MKKINVLTTILSVSAVLVLGSSCNKAADPVADEGGLSPIVLGADMPEMNVSAETKATDNTVEVTSLSSFKVSCVTGDSNQTSVWANVPFSGTTEFTSPAGNKKYWPYGANPGYYKFYATNASANMTHAATGTTVVAANTQDVVCAYLGTTTPRGTAAQNKLVFEHVFARLNKVTVSPASGYALSDVTITMTPNTKGTYNLLTGAWTGTSSERSYPVAAASSIAAGSSSTTDNTVYLVPGSYTLTATWTAMIGGWSNTYSGKVSTSSVPFVKGHITSVNVTLGGNASEIVLGYSITPWATDATPVPVTFPNS